MQVNMHKLRQTTTKLANVTNRRCNLSVVAFGAPARLQQYVTVVDVGSDEGIMDDRRADS